MLGANAATLQEQIDAARPGETIRLAPGIHSGPVRIDKPLTLTGQKGSVIRGNGNGSVITIGAAHVTIEGLRVTGSGLHLSDDDAAIFVTGNGARIEHCLIDDSLHGIYLKKVSGARS